MACPQTRLWVRPAAFAAPHGDGPAQVLHLLPSAAPIITHPRRRFKFYPRPPAGGGRRTCPPAGHPCSPCPARSEPSARGGKARPRTPPPRPHPALCSGTAVGPMPSPTGSRSSPRRPCGQRPKNGSPPPGAVLGSAHAALRDGDTPHSRGRNSRVRFSPRHACGRRSVRYACSRIRQRFRPLPPLRAATAAGRRLGARNAVPVLVVPADGGRHRLWRCSQSICSDPAASLFPRLARDAKKPPAAWPGALPVKKPRAAAFSGPRRRGGLFLPAQAPGSAFASPGAFTAANSRSSRFACRL